MFFLATLAFVLPLSAATVIQMNLQEMVDRADRIFRGTVLDAREGTVAAGGGQLPVVTYRIRVEESFKGTYGTVKGMQIAEIKMVGKLTPSNASPIRALSALSELPRLEVGKEYLLLTTARSSIGLSTTVGLGQGRFVLQGKPGQELAVNDNQNYGLLDGMAPTVTADAAEEAEGPMPYQELAGLIRNLVGA
jgi:hypothetical protein